MFARRNGTRRDQWFGHTVLQSLVVLLILTLSLPEPIQAQSLKSTFNNAAANARLAQQRNQAMQLRLRQQEQLRADRLRANRERQAAQDRAIRQAQQARTLARQKAQAAATRAAQQTRDRVSLEARKLHDLQQQAIRTRLMAGTALYTSRAVTSNPKVTLPVAKQGDLKSQLASLAKRKPSIEGTRQFIPATTARPSLNEAMRTNLSRSGPLANSSTAKTDLPKFKETPFPKNYESYKKLGFGKNDLVLGLYRNGSQSHAKRIAEATGAKLATADKFSGTPTPKEMSLMSIQSAAKNGRQIRFDLSGMKSVDRVLQGKAYRSEITSAELRYIKDNWSRFSRKPRFYANGQEVRPPWEK